MLNFKENIDVIERIVINYILSDESEYTLLDDDNNAIDRIRLLSSVNKRFFDNEVIIRIIEIIKDYVKEYGRIPNQREIVSVIEVKGYDIEKEELEVVLGYDITSHNSKMVYKYIKTFVLMGNLSLSLMQVTSHLKTSEIDPNNIDEIYDFVRSHINQEMQVDLTDEGKGLDVLEPEAHIQLTKSTKSTGFPFLDKVLGGGWEKKTLVVFEGRPKVGKCSLGSTMITVRNKHTGVIEHVSIKDFHERLK